MVSVSGGSSCAEDGNEYNKWNGKSKAAVIVDKKAAYTSYVDCGAGRAVADGGQRFRASSMNWRRLLGFQSARRRSIHVKEVKAGAVRDGGRGGSK